MNKGEAIDVTFFEKYTLPGLVEEIDDITTTIIFVKPMGEWAVKVPRAWIRRENNRLVLDLA